MYPNAYIRYLVHFHGNRDYFECHEILEEFWKQEDAGNKMSVWVGLIQLAVSCYHYRRSNYTGAKKTLEKAIKVFNKEGKALSRLGLNKSELFSILMDCLNQIEQKRPYKSFNLPINDPLLLRKCQMLCSELGFIWFSDSDINNPSLVHRHKLRDRTEVIEDRIRAIKAKKDSESN